MTALDLLDRELESWLASDAQGDVPAGLHQAVIARARRTRQWPAWLATTRIAGAEAWSGSVGRTAARVTDQRTLMRYAIIAALLALASVAAALLAGALFRDLPTGRILIVTSRVFATEDRGSGSTGCDFLHGIDARTGAVTALVRCADQLRVSPDGRYAARSADLDPFGAGTSLLVMDLRDGRERTVAEGSGRTYQPVEWSADGRWLRWVACGEEPLGGCVDFIGSAADGFKAVPGDPSTNGLLAAFERQAGRPISRSPSGDVWVANAVGRGMHQAALFEDPGPSEAVVSPDGQTIAVVAAVPSSLASPSPVPELWLVDADFGDPRQVDLGPVYAAYEGANAYELLPEIRWSSDSSRLMVFLTAGLADERVYGGAVNWEPFGRLATVLAEEVLVISAESLDVVVIHDADPQRGGGPLWSPDVRHLALMSEQGGVELVNADGTGRRLLATIPQPQVPDTFYSQLFAWLPDVE